MHFPYAIACQPPLGPLGGELGLHSLARLRAETAAGRPCAAFLGAAPDPALLAALPAPVEIVLVRADADPLSVNMGGPELNHTRALDLALTAFLREHTIERLEFPATAAEGFYFLQRNRVHRLVPATAVHLAAPPRFLRDEAEGHRRCDLHRGLLYAAELEALAAADHLLAPAPATAEPILAAFPPAESARLRARLTPDFPPIAPPPSPLASFAPRLTFVIPHLDHADTLAELLAALDASPDRALLDVLVVDDGSAPATLARLETLRHSASAPRFTLLHTARPRSGPFAARLLGLEHATTESVAFADADDRPEPDLYLRYAAALAREPDLDVVLPAMRCFGRETQDWIPLPKAPFTAFHSSFAHSALVGRRDVLLRAFAHAAPAAAGLAHAEDCIVALSLLFNGARIATLAECAYHYRRAGAESRSQSNPHLLDRSRLARERHVDRCLAEALAAGRLTPLDLRLIRELALALPPAHSATHLHSRRNHVPWHTHLYRALRSALGDPRYRG